MEFIGVTDIAVYGMNCVADIALSDDEQCSFISAKDKYFDIKCDNGQLTISQKKSSLISRIIMRRIEFKLRIPKSFAGRLRFRIKNGGVYIKGGRYTDLELSTKNGKFVITDAMCSEFKLKMRNGSVRIKNLSAARSARIKCSTVAIKAESVTAPEFIITNDNGALSLADIKADSCDFSTTNGDIEATATVVSDLILDTSNGKINAMAIGKRAEYKLSLETTYGTITLDGTPSNIINDAAPAEKRIVARTSTGDIDLKFSN